MVNWILLLVAILALASIKRRPPKPQPLPPDYHAHPDEPEDFTILTMVTRKDADWARDEIFQVCRLIAPKSVSRHPNHPRVLFLPGRGYQRELITSVLGHEHFEMDEVDKGDPALPFEAIFV